MTDRTELIRSTTKSFLRLSNEELKLKPAPDKWSICEVFEHLLITQDIYFKLILPKIAGAPDKDAEIHKSSIIGNFVYMQIKPKPDGSVFKLPAPKILYPTNNETDAHLVINNFLQQLDVLHDILQHASTKDIQRIKIPFAVASFIKLRLGDSLRFLIA
ncbi:MAG: DinB family protein, partial [Bacteroidetes bacterium]|nr:DinB family protein [Bacteroidota bacterium]